MRTHPLFIALALCLSSLSGTALAQARDLCRIDLQENDYVIYSDTRAGNRVLGVMYKGKDDYLVRSYDIDSGKELVFKVGFDYTQEEIKSRDYAVVSGTDDGDFKYLMDFTLLIVASDRVDRTSFPGDIPFGQEYGPDGKKTKAEYLFKYWVPVLNLFSVTFEDGKKIQAVDMGRPGKDEDPRFYGYKAWYEDVRGPSYKVEVRDSLKIRYDRCHLVLDKNWRQEGNTLVLARKTPRDAQIGFDNFGVDKDRMGLGPSSHLVGAVKMLSLGVPVIAESVQVADLENAVVLDYYVYNPEDRMSTHVFDVYRFVGEDRVDEMTLFSYASLYLDNQDYFLAIVNSLVGGQ